MRFLQTSIGFPVFEGKNHVNVRVFEVKTSKPLYFRRSELFSLNIHAACLKKPRQPRSLKSEFEFQTGIIDTCYKDNPEWIKFHSFNK